MKKHLALILIPIFVCIDQAIKLLIARFCIHAHVPIIQNVLTFHPMQNKNLNWIASMANYHTPVILMVVIQVIALALLAVIYRYLVFAEGKGYFSLKLFLAFFVSGILCSMSDVIFWGGSLDFIRLFNWFIFDTKDIFLSTGVIFICIYFAIITWKQSKLSKEEREQLKQKQSVRHWLKSGLPISDK